MLHHRSSGQRASKGQAPGSLLIDVRQVVKSYTTPSGAFTALKGVSLQVQAGEFVAVVGKSGSGKSTLINLIAGIDRPSSGEINIAHTPVHALSQEQLAIWRGRNVGVVFQFFQLLPTLTVAENVVLPMDFCNTYPVRERRPRALALLDRVGIAEQADKLPSALSGGQQQRAAIARALANDPSLIVADEPTGNLDSRSGAELLSFMRRSVDEFGQTIVMVTHDPNAAAFADRVLFLADGRIVDEMAEPTAERVLDYMKKLGA